MYINKKSGEYYNGGSLTVKTTKGIFSGVPTEEQLERWGYEEYIPPVEEFNNIDDVDSEESQTD